MITSCNAGLFRLNLISIALFTSLAGSAASAAPVSTTITSFGIVATPRIKKGDTVDLEVTLSTSDANENGEGEPITVTSSGGFNITVNSYGQPQAFSFKASADNETLSAAISGADGDESGVILVDVNQKKRFTQEQKDAFARSSAQLNVQAGAEAVVAALCLVAPDPSVTKACAFGAGALSGATWLLSAALNELALDPIDPNYKVIVLPATVKFPLLTAQPGITQTQAAAFNALLTNEAEATGLAKAIIASVNKSQGAAQAGDSNWEAKQMQAAGEYSLKLNTFLASQASLRATIKTALDSGSFKPIAFSASDVFAYESKVANSGLPDPLKQSLIAFGADALMLDKIRKVVFVQDTKAVAGTFPANLADTKLELATAQAGDALLTFALSNAVPLKPGRHVGGLGRVDITGGTVLFEFNAEQHLIPLPGISTLTGGLRLQNTATGFTILQSKITKAAVMGKSLVIDGSYQGLDGSNGTFHLIGQHPAIFSQPNKPNTLEISLSNGLKIKGPVKLGGLLF